MTKTLNDIDNKKSNDLINLKFPDCSIEQKDEKIILKFKSYHSKEYLEKVKKEINNENVVFILPNDKEYKNEKETKRS